MWLRIDDMMLKLKILVVLKVYYFDYSDIPTKFLDYLIWSCKNRPGDIVQVELKFNRFKKELNSMGYELHCCR